LSAADRRGRARSRGGLAAVVWASGISLVLAGPTGRGDEPSGKLPGPASALLDEAEAIEILSIDPKGRPSRPEDDFHGWKVLGRTTLRDPGTRTRVVAASRRGVEEAGPAAGCFEPRHGLRATKGARSADLVICFACGWIEVRAGGEAASVRTSSAAKPVFNKLLCDAGVALAPEPEGP
jgi:hypothetical protein